MILVDNAYFGQAMRHSRKNARLKRDAAAKMLGLAPEALRKCENGKMLIPENVLWRAFYHAFIMLDARYADKKRRE